MAQAGLVDRDAIMLAVELPPLHDAAFDVALRLAVGAGARAMVLPQVACEADIQHLDICLTVIEEEEAASRPPASIIARPADTPEGAAFAADFRRLSRRLTALLWDQAETRAALGLAPDDTADGQALLAHVRSRLLLSAHAAGLAALMALPAAPPATQDEVQALRALCRNALRQGFSGFVAGSRSQATLIAAPEEGD
ncbi:hypothetical protein [Rhizobium sp. CSW-27]|uniref:hypothetical protein n=1 Tax=Rhizobium sp. CSW-27 TaxID=2839985 RepID=UPI001C00F310|nr:hypothetical protein [Rhizobium sp. CSW-27]MBT9370124.1 hypothetical protein [Rhizobium sp. CSW-27]